MRGAYAYGSRPRGAFRLVVVAGAGGLVGAAAYAFTIGGATAGACTIGAEAAAKVFVLAGSAAGASSIGAGVAAKAFVLAGLAAGTIDTGSSLFDFTLPAGRVLGSVEAGTGANATYVAAKARPLGGVTAAPTGKVR